MVEKRPGAAEAKTAAQTVMPRVGLAEESKGEVVPLHLVDTFISLRVGQMKAELERDFSSHLKKIDDLPTKWQLIAGGMSAVIVTVGLLFGILSYFGDRQDSAVDRSATVSQTLSRIENKLEAAPPQPQAAKPSEK